MRLFAGIAIHRDRSIILARANLNVEISLSELFERYRRTDRDVIKLDVSFYSAAGHKINDKCRYAILRRKSVSRTAITCLESRRAPTTR